MKSRLLIIFVGIVLTSIIFGTHQYLMYQCGTLPTFAETPRSPNLWNCLQIWENQSEQHPNSPPPINLSAEKDSRRITGEDYCHEWCDNDELYQMGCDQPILTHLTKHSNLLDEEFNGTFNIDLIGLPDGVSTEKFEECVDIIYEKRLDESKTKKLWKSTDDWNSLGLIRNDDGLYCISASEESSDKCYSLKEIVFGNAHKSWTVFPGGVGPVPPENFTLTKIYKDSGFAMPTLNFEAMLDDKIFVNKCESNGGVWNYTYHDCENLWQVCRDVDGIMIQEDITKSCTEGVCLDGKVYRISCVFEYEQ